MRAIAILLALALPASAQEVDLELVLLADASGSITQSEIDFQRQGYASAITDPTVLDVIANTLTGSIAVTYVEWAGNQATVVDWTIIDGPASATAFAEALLAQPRLAYGRNAIGAALIEGKRLIETNEITGLRRVIDFSGDSANNYQPHGAVHPGRQVQVVRGDQRRKPGVAHQIHHQRGKDLIRGGGVKVARRFIRQQQARPIGQRPAEGHALLLAPRQRGGAVACARRHAHAAQQVASRAPRPAPFAPRHWPAAAARCFPAPKTRAAGGGTGR
jgi:hypothetical protein